MFKKIAILTISILFCFCFFACEKSEIQPIDEKGEELVERGKGLPIESTLEMSGWAWEVGTNDCHPPEDIPYYITQYEVISGGVEETYHFEFNENPNYTGGEPIGFTWEVIVDSDSSFIGPFSFNSSTDNVDVYIPDGFTAEVSFIAVYEDDSIGCDFLIEMSNEIIIDAPSVEACSFIFGPIFSGDNITMILPYKSKHP